MTEREYNAGDIILKEGDPSDFAYMILSGDNSGQAALSIIPAALRSVPGSGRLRYPGSGKYHRNTAQRAIPGSPFQPRF